MNVKEIRESLIKQLEAKGALEKHFVSLVDDYCWYWRQEKEMQADIRKKGRVYDAFSAAGKPYEKDNPSVKNAMLYNRQKLSILRELGLQTDALPPPEDHADDSSM